MLGATRTKKLPHDPSWHPRGALLGLPWGPLGALLGRLGRPWDRLGALWTRLGALVSRLEASLGGFGRCEIQGSEHTKK